MVVIGEGESSVGGGAKRFKQSNYVYDAEVNGFPVRYQTCLMLVPYCNADHIPPKKISIEEAEVYAEEGEQPPLDSPSYIEYIKDKYGNLKRHKNGKPMWRLRCGAVFNVGFLLQPSVSNKRSDNESIYNFVDRESLYTIVQVGPKCTFQPTSMLPKEIILWKFFLIHREI